MNAGFEELLKKWNRGVFRGAQQRLAKRLGIKQSTVSRWVSGTLSPGEELRFRVAKELGVTDEELAGCFSPGFIVRERGPGYAAGPGLSEIMGRLEQITIQIALLQGDVGKSNRDIEEVKGRLNAIETTRGPEAARRRGGTRKKNTHPGNVQRPV